MDVVVVDVDVVPLLAFVHALLADLLAGHVDVVVVDVDGVPLLASVLALLAYLLG
jgi:hypothetical protein